MTGWSTWLASSLGYAKQITGSYQVGFLIFAALVHHLGCGASDGSQDLIWRFL